MWGMKMLTARAGCGAVYLWVERLFHVILFYTSYGPSY